jgi:hypothetical protein
VTHKIGHSFREREHREKEEILPEILTATPFHHSWRYHTRNGTKCLHWMIAVPYSVGLIAVVCLTLAFYSPGSDREVRFVSADGRQAVVLAADGLSLLTLQTQVRYDLLAVLLALA